MVVFGVLALFAAVLETTKKTSAVDNSSKDFLRFKNNYVLVYALMMGTRSDTIPHPNLCLFGCRVGAGSKSFRWRAPSFVTMGCGAFECSSIASLDAASLHACSASRSMLATLPAPWEVPPQSWS